MTHRITSTMRRMSQSGMANTMIVKWLKWCMIRVDFLRVGAVVLCDCGGEGVDVCL